MTKLQWNSEYYHEEQRTCFILKVFTYLMTSKLIYLLMDWEIHCLHSNRSEVQPGSLKHRP